MLLGALLALHALAGGHYDPTEIARQSKTYAKAADKAGSTFRARGSQAEAIAEGLNRYEEALDLLGERAPAGERARHAALKKSFNREKAVLQIFAQTLLEDFDGEFSDAVDRAAPDGTVACRTMIPKGKALPGMPAPMKKNPDCTGEDHTAAIIAAVDADPALNAAINEIVALEWPPLTVPNQPQPAVGQAERWVAVQPWMQRMMPGALKTIRREDEESRLSIEAKLEDNPSPEVLQSLVADSKAIDAKTAKRRADAASSLLAAVDGWNAKKAKKDQDVGWCANPEFFGGCSGSDVSDSVGDELREDKKVARARP